MNYEQIVFEQLDVTAQIASFTPEGGVGEWHVMLHVTSRGDVFEQQYARIRQAEEQLLKLPGMQGAQMVFKRYFLSDATNQQPIMLKDAHPCTTSYIQQPPLDGSKVAVWIYLASGMEVTGRADELGSTLASHNGYKHLWTMGMTVPEGSSYAQTRTLLEDYEQMLAGRDATMEANCIRTWFFVRDVDTSYKGLVVARRENFEREGLARGTHYIASTGIGGNPANPKAIIQFGCYSAKGFEREQQTYLRAQTHLNRTDEYGVTFERGTKMQYGDRSHLYISGTASINNKGEVVYEGDVKKQTERMWENVEKLLEEGGATYDDVMQIIVYLRDISDYELVSRLFRERMPDIPTVFTLAPVCRPTWLVEMECIAVTKDGNTSFRNF